MHPAISFGAVLAGAALFGATGAVLALPVVATLQSFLTVYIERHNVIDSSLVAGEHNETSAENTADDIAEDIESETSN